MMNLQTLTFESHPHLPCWQLSRPPKALYGLGNLQLLNDLPHRGLTVVGSRGASVQAKIQIEHELPRLQPGHWIVLSGLARGIDTTAHWAALQSDLKTIAIVAGGLQHCYPPQNIELRNKILEAGGLLLSEHKPDIPPLPYHFPLRNRLLASLSRATWVVQAGPKSGAMTTAHWALEYERKVFVTPCFPKSSSFCGNQFLLENHPETLPFWDITSLGCVWLELAAKPP